MNVKQLVKALNTLDEDAEVWVLSAEGLVGRDVALVQGVNNEVGIVGNVSKSDNE